MAINILDFFTSAKLSAMSDNDIKLAAETNQFSIADLFKAGKIDHERYKRLTYVEPEQHYENLINRFSSPSLSLKYTNEYIKELINEEQITESQLKSRGIFNQDDLAVIMGRPLEKKEYKGGAAEITKILNELPHPAENRVDIFLLGVAGSGKSSFLSGILKAAKDSGNLDLPMMLDEAGNVVNGSGRVYAQHLINAVEFSLPPQRNAFEFLTYLAVNLRDEKGQVHPLSFMEMSGELFQDCFGKNKNQLREKLQAYLFHDNVKMLCCVIDYNIHREQQSATDIQQWMHFDWFLNLLDANGTMKKCVVISILITKWDLAPDQSPEGARSFLEREYKLLYKTCERYATMYKLKFQIITFSLGYFDARNAVTYNPKDSVKVVNWLCDNTPIEIARTKRWYQ